MSIIKRELKTGLKAFLFWSLGLFVMVFIGITKFTGIEAGGEGIAGLLNSIPKVVLAVLGIAGVDLSSFGGYYAIISQFAVILTAVYAIWLGHTAVSKESIDKTYEFLFTKPKSRTWFLSRKILAGVIYLTVYCMFNLLFSAVSITVLDLGGDAAFSLAPFAASVWLVGFTFFSLEVCFAAAARNAETGARLGNAGVLIAYIAGAAYDMLETGGLLRFFSPFRYFLPSELLSGRVDSLFAVLCLTVSVIALGLGFRLFERRDLNAV